MDTVELELKCEPGTETPPEKQIISSTPHGIIDDVVDDTLEAENDNVFCFCLICGLAVDNTVDRGGGGSETAIFQFLMELFGMKRRKNDHDGDDQLEFCTDCGDQLKFLVALRKKLKQLEQELMKGIESINEKLAKSESRFQTVESLPGERKPDVIRRNVFEKGKTVTPKELEKDQIESKPVPGPLRRSARCTKGKSRFYNTDDTFISDENDESVVVATSSATVSPDELTAVTVSSLSDSDSHSCPPNIKIEVEDKDIEDDPHTPVQDPLEMDGDDAEYLPEPESGDSSFSESSSDSDSEGMASEYEHEQSRPPMAPTQTVTPKPTLPSKPKRGSPLKKQKRQPENNEDYITVNSKRIKSSKIIMSFGKPGEALYRKIRVNPLTGNCMYLNISFQKIEESKYKCLTCEEVVTSLSTMKKHTIRTHTDNYVCNYCGQHKTSRGELRKHVSEVHEGKHRKPPKKTKECPICGKPFGNKVALEFHRATHFSEEDRLEAEARGEKIVRYKEKYGRVQCVKCGETFCNVTWLKKHDIKKHSTTEEEKQEVLRVCSHCGKSFSEAYFNQHVERYHSDLDITTLKPFQCSECGKRFYTASKLRLHKVIHSGERAYQCDMCCKNFTTSKNLKHHVMRNHTNERPHQCLLCPSAFVTRDHLNRHVAGVHEGKKQTWKSTRKSDPLQEDPLPM